MKTVLEPVIQKSLEANKATPEDYIGEDGLLVCGKCHTRKQTRISLPQMGEITVGCLCSCGQEAYRQEQLAQKHKEETYRLERLRSVGITNQRLRNASFASDDRQNPGPMDKLRRYAEAWERMEQSNTGLLLYGGVGTGKSYGAACIANYLVERFIPVLMTNFAGVLNALAPGCTEDRNAYIADMMRYPLLILDDFGMERDTEFALEQVYNVIDSRYRSGKPLIITTNLTQQELTNPKDIDHARIYDRVLEMCVPINFGSKGRRAGYAEAKKREAARVLLEG